MHIFQIERENMLQRAASNAYSWWWASHVRTKQSKWLEQNLQDMEDRVSNMVAIIDDDGDSFAQRAEMYYRKRPELLDNVEETFRAYRALAERYDHLSGELQSANRTIASVFPEQAQFASEDDEENSHDATTSEKLGKLPKDLQDATKINIPQVPSRPPLKHLRNLSMRLSKKGPIKRNRSSFKATTKPSSGLSRSEALGEIDKLQKGILVFQTEKEFVKCLYEHNYGRYWDIEEQISEMQTKVSSLQDEFGIGTVIEDEEARKLMAATALKSCEAALDKLEGRQEQSVEKEKLESQRIKEADEKFQALKDKYLPDQMDRQEFSSAEYNDTGEDTNTADQEKHDVDTQQAKITNDLDENTDNSLSVPQLTETIDELVDKVVTLETEVSSQATLVQQLQSETDELNSHVRDLEEDNEDLIEDSENMKQKLKELEEELRRVKFLSRSFKEQSKNLQTKFTETSSKLDNLSDKLPTIKLEEENSDTGLFQEKRQLSAVKGVEHEERDDKHASCDISSVSDIEQKKDHDEITASNSKFGEESCSQSQIGNNFDAASEWTRESMQHEKDLFHIFSEEQGTEDEDGSGWRQMFLNGLEDREKFLLEEYTAVLRNYNNVRKQLSEVEKKNRDGLFELTMQLRELRQVNSIKDQEIQFLRQQLSSSQSCVDDSLETSSTYSYYQEEPHDCNSEPAYSPYMKYSTMNTNKQQTYDSLRDLGSTGKIEKLSALSKVKDGRKGIQVNDVDNTHTGYEDKLRLEIDELLEENLEFWLRFSNAYHQIQKFQSSVHDLQDEWLQVKESKKPDGSNKKQEGGTLTRFLQSEARPIYKHLKEIQTELTLWLEHNIILLDELQDRFSSLGDIQEQISRIAKEGNRDEEAKLTRYQAAKFQGETLNMKQENRKIADELRAGLDHVRGLQKEVSKTLATLDDELGFSKHSSGIRSASTRPRIPLRSFLFGVKLKKQKQTKHSLFACMSPAFQKQFSNLGGRVRRV